MIPTHPSTKADDLENSEDISSASKQTPPSAPLYVAASDEQPTDTNSKSEPEASGIVAPNSAEDTAADPLSDVTDGTTDDAIEDTMVDDIVAHDLSLIHI